MAKKIEIRLTDNPSNSDYFAYYPVVTSEFYYLLTTIHFRTTATTIYDVKIKASKTLTIDELFNVVTALYSDKAWIEVTKVTNGIDILFTPNDTTFTTIGTPIVGDITMTIVDVTIDDFTRDNIVLSRSPYNLSLEPTALFDLATLELKLYRGDVVTDLPIDSNFGLSKPVIKAGQSIINFEISKFLNDFTKANIPTFGATGVHTSTLYDSVWLNATITAYYLGTSIGTATRTLLAIDGFGWHTELYNPKLTTSVLSTITNHTIYSGSDYPLYFVSKDLVSIVVNGTSISFTLDENVNNQLIAYVNIGAYIGSSTSFTAVFTYSYGTETHYFTIKEECRNPIYNCFFKNKYGFWQSIPFVKRAKEKMDVESSDYMPIISSFGQYSLASHQTKTTNVQATDRITCNTDFLNENYNLLFNELMVSEFVYLENNGQYLPVNLDKKTFERKNKLNDKLIQYTMDFKYSFNKLNQVI